MAIAMSGLSLPCGAAGFTAASQTATLAASVMALRRRAPTGSAGRAE